MALNTYANAGARLVRHCSPSISHMPRLFSAAKSPSFAVVARPALKVTNKTTDNTTTKVFLDDNAHGYSPDDYASIVGVSFDSTRGIWTARWTTADGQKKTFSRSVSKHGFFQAKRMAEQARTEAVAAGARTRGRATRNMLVDSANNSAGTAAKALLDDKAYGHSPDDYISIVGVTFDRNRGYWIARWTTADGQKKSFSRSAAMHGFFQAKHMAEQARTEAVAEGARTRGHATRRMLEDTAFYADFKAGSAQHQTAGIGSSTSHYEVLGITEAASLAEIKAAFKEAAKRFHPDVSKEPGAEQHFVAINQANDVLSDAKARAAYDVTLLMQKSLQLKAMKTAMEARAWR